MGLDLAGGGEGCLELGRTRMRVLIFSEKILSRPMPCVLSASSCDCSSWVRCEQRAYPMRMSAPGVSVTAGSAVGCRVARAGPGRGRSVGVGTRSSLASRGTFLNRPVW